MLYTHYLTTWKHNKQALSTGCEYLCTIIFWSRAGFKTVFFQIPHVDSNLSTKNVHVRNKNEVIHGVNHLVQAQQKTLVCCCCYFHLSHQVPFCMSIYYMTQQNTTQDRTHAKLHNLNHYVTSYLYFYCKNATILTEASVGLQECAAFKSQERKNLWYLKSYDYHS